MSEVDVDNWSPDPDEEHFMVCMRVGFEEVRIEGTVEGECHDCQTPILIAPQPPAMRAIGGPHGGMPIDLTRITLLKVCGFCGIKRADADGDLETSIRIRYMIRVVEGVDFV